MQDKTMTDERHVDFLERYRLEGALAEMTAQRDKWREIAERLYNATFEYDHSVMRNAIALYEEMPDGQ
jgi:hypothetical protein